MHRFSRRLDQFGQQIAHCLFLNQLVIIQHKDKILFELSQLDLTFTDLKYFGLFRIGDSIRGGQKKFFLSRLPIIQRLSQFPGGDPGVLDGIGCVCVAELSLNRRDIAGFSNYRVSSINYRLSSIEYPASSIQYPVS